MKNLNKKQFVVVNNISRCVLEKTRDTGLFHPHMKKLSLQGYSNSELSMFFTLRNLLFFSVNDEPLEVKSYVQLKFFIKKVLEEFYSFQKDGFVSRGNLEYNKIFNIFKSFYPSYHEIFNNKQSPYISWRYELEHFHNLVILILLLEIELYLKHRHEEISDENNDFWYEEEVFLKQDRQELNSLLSGGLRLSLSKNRLMVTNRIYVGFDTEYTNVDSTTNEILCYTTSTLTESFIKIREGNIDFSLKEGLVYQPHTSVLITIAVKLIRQLRNKKDFEIDRLRNDLKRDCELECLSLSNQDLIFRKRSRKANLINDIKTSFFDLRNDPSNYSFQNLLETILSETEHEFTPLCNFNGRDLLDFNPTLKRECFLTAHFTTADVSLFKDFSLIKEKFTVLNKSFLTLDRIIRYRNWKVYLRDSSLLSPAGMSLKSIGELYPQLPLTKLELKRDDIQNMDVFFERDKKLFEEYAKQDSKIVLWHTVQVQESHYQLTGKYTIPVTLSSLASSFLTKRLVKETDYLYHPKTKNGLISVKNLARLNTPMGIELSGDLHEYIDYFLGSYHGGRNESYLYGIIKGEFHDYDLPGAYPTAMAMLDYPDWDSREMIGKVSGEDFYERYKNNLIESYTALKIKFEFPSTVKYPNLPVRLDFSSVVFPLTGETFCTGHEFLLAKNLGCKIKILSGVHIPFRKVSVKPENVNSPETGEKRIFVQDPLLKKIIEKNIKNLWDSNDKFLIDPKEPEIESEFESESENYSFLKRQLTVSPCENNDCTRINSNSNFFLVVQELLSERIKHSKGTYMNLLYKFLANAGIGQMARGLNQKVRFDSKTNSPRTLPSGELVSPLYAGWITSYIRTVLSEIMNKSGENSLIVSCTTDGFISNEPGLETAAIESTDVFSLLYYNMRLKLTGTGALLERKYYEPKGLISWRTRGQLGLSGGIKALTGYQRHESIEQTIDIVEKSFKNSKQIAFIQTSLRSAKDIFQKGGHSTLKLSERFFNLKFDNRREISEDKGTYHITKPFVHCLNSSQNRLISTFGSGRYKQYSPISKTHCGGDAYLSLTRRMIVRLLRDRDFLNLKLSRREIQKILKEIGLSCTLNYISKQKDKKPIYNSIPSTKKTLKCLKNLKIIFPYLKIEMLVR